MLNVDNSLALMNSSFKPNDIKIQSENDLLLKRANR